MEEIGNYLNIFVADRIVGPDRYLHLVPRTYEYVTHMAKEIFSDVTALGILKWDHGLSAWAQGNHNSPYMWKRQAEQVKGVVKTDRLE